MSTNYEAISDITSFRISPSSLVHRKSIILWLYQCKTKFYQLSSGIIIFWLIVFLVQKNKLSLQSSTLIEEFNRIKTDWNTTLPACEQVENVTKGRIPIDKTVPSFHTLEVNNPNLLPGGHYLPPNCTATCKLALVVPYRSRPDQLRVFLQHIHPFLARQYVEYTIYVAHQADNKPFNRGALFNAGFLEAAKDQDWDCLVLHDVDLLPEDDRNLYRCRDTETYHLMLGRNTDKYELAYYDNLGGAVALKPSLYTKLNGFSNSFWGWGGEDDNFSERHGHHNITFVRNSQPQIGRYTMLGHKPERPSKDRFRQLEIGRQKFESDGLNSINYTLHDKILYPTYTNLLVELDSQPR